MTVRRIEGGPARSSKEISLAVGELVCPTCGNHMRTRWAEETDQGAVVRMYSRQCDTELDVVFTAGPGWAERPDDSDPRYSATDAPSTLVSEAVFRREYDQALGRLRAATPPPPDDGDPADLEIWDSSIRADAHAALGALLELRKLSPAMDATLEPWLRAVLEAPRTSWRGPA